MTKTKFFATVPKTRAEFIKKFRNDYIFRNWCAVFGFKVVQDNVIFPNGKIAGVTVK